MCVYLYIYKYIYIYIYNKYTQHTNTLCEQKRLDVINQRLIVLNIVVRTSIKNN